MAEIPLEKKSGTPGWLWPLLALLLGALLLWWLLSDDDEVESTQQTTTVAEQTASPTTSVATTAAVAAGAAGAAATAMTVGQSVDLDNVRVTSLAGDMAFNAEANGQNMFVVFDEEPTPADPSVEGQIDIKPGSVLNLEGTVRAATEAMPAGVTAQIPAGTQQYLYARSIQVVQ